jgi:hypothetical protein
VAAMARDAYGTLDTIKAAVAKDDVKKRFVAKLSEVHPLHPFA